MKPKGKRKEFEDSIENGSSLRPDMPPAVVAVNDGNGVMLHTAAADRGVKRKSASMNQDSGVGVVGHTAAGGTSNGKDTVSDEKRQRKLEKRLMKEKLVQQLKEAEAERLAIEEREKQLLSRGHASVSESAGDRSKPRIGENGSRLRGTLPSGLHEESGFGETAQSEPQRLKQMPPTLPRALVASPSINGKRMPKANPAYMNDDFVLGTDKLLIPEKPKSKLSGSKRPAPPRLGEQRTVKRQRVEEAREKRMAGIFRDLLSLVKRVLNQKMAWVFAKPVDPVALNLPDYFTVIKNPMDLGTVKTRLEKSQYAHPVDALADVRLTFSNALRYNPPGNDVNFMAKSMSDLFEKGYEKVEAKLRQEAMKVEQEERELENEDEYYADEVDPLDGRAVESHIGGRRLSGGRQVFSHPRPGRSEKEKRDMTLEEKRRLGVNLGKLPPEKLAAVVDIVNKYSAPDMNQTGDEIELDIDALNSEALWELERYVSNTMKSKHKGKKKNGESRLTAREAHTGDGKAALETGDVEDNVDIGDDAPPPPGPADEKARAGKSSSSGGSSSDDSGSSSSGSSGSDSGSGSEEEADEVQSKEAGSKKDLVAAKSEAAPERQNKVSAEASVPAEGKSLSGEGNGLDHEASGAPKKEGDSGAEEGSGGEEKGKLSHVEVFNALLLSSKKINAEPQTLRTMADLRATLLRNKYAISILNAKSKRAGRGNEKLEPEEQAEIERKRKEELEQLEAEARLADEEMKLHLEKVVLEEKMKREEKRAAARERVKNMAETVYVDESSAVLRRLEELGSNLGAGAFPSNAFSSGEMKSMSLPLFDVESLGLLRKHDESEDEEESDEEKEEEEQNEEDEEGEIVPGNDEADEGEVVAGSGGEEIEEVKEEIEEFEEEIKEEIEEMEEEIEEMKEIEEIKEEIEEMKEIEEIEEEIEEIKEIKAD